MNAQSLNPQAGYPVLSGLAKCHTCGNPMTVPVDDAERPSRYACPNALGPDENACDTPEVETRRLDQLVLEHLIADVLTDDLLQEIITHVRQDAAQQALQQQHHLDSVHGELERLDHERAKLVADVEQGETGYTDVSGRLARMGDGWRSIRDEARQAERALQGYRYVADDDDRVASYARNLDTYLRDMNAATTRSLLELIVNEVLVAAGSVTVTYNIPLPLGSEAGHTHSIMSL